MVGIGSFFVLSQLPIREQLAACIEIVDLNTNFVCRWLRMAMPRPPTTPTLSWTFSSSSLTNAIQYLRLQTRIRIWQPVKLKA